MIKLGVNTVLFKKYTLREAMEAIKKAGYDGVELSGIKGMCEHLPVDEWREAADRIKQDAAEVGVELLSAEIASLDEQRLTNAFEAARYIGIPVLNVGPMGKTGDEEGLRECIATVKARAALAAEYGVTLCMKAHVGASVYNTETTQAVMAAVPDGHFGVDMDPSHIHRAGEVPKLALPGVLSRVKHIHIRDCKGEGPSPGLPADQACGRGDIDLFGYMEAMVNGGYDGPVCLEVIGPDQDMTDAAIIAAESYGYMNAILKKLGAR